MNAEEAADLWTKPISLSRRSTHTQLANHVHHRHLLLLNPQADTHFTIPQRVEG